MAEMNVRLFHKTSKENLKKAIDALSLLRTQYLDEAENEVWDQLYDAGCFLEARLAIYESFEEVSEAVTAGVNEESQ